MERGSAPSSSPSPHIETAGLSGRLGAQALALDEQPPRLDTRLLFPGARGGYLELHAWRWREWYPALRGAGVERRVPYSLRHTFASLSIAAGVSLFELSRFMGTTPQMLDKTYGHLLPDALDRARTALDVFVADTREAEEATT